MWTNYKSWDIPMSVQKYSLPFLAPVIETSILVIFIWQNTVIVTINYIISSQKTPTMSVTLKPEEFNLSQIPAYWIHYNTVELIIGCHFHLSGSSCTFQSFLKHRWDVLVKTEHFDCQVQTWTDYETVASVSLIS